MVELQHRQDEPSELAAFLAAHPDPAVSDFDSLAFAPAKRAVKAALNQDQGGLCVYCERELVANAGQIDHIKPKAGEHAHPELCFSYRNYAHSCIHPKTCGQKKGDRLLPIEPGPGCNQQWGLSRDGRIEPVAFDGQTRQQRHQVRQACDMLGLNADTTLVIDRKDWYEKTRRILETMPEALDDFLSTAPFRHILATLF